MSSDCATNPERLVVCVAFSFIRPESINTIFEAGLLTPSTMSKAKGGKSKTKTDADAPGKDAQSVIASESGSKSNRNMSISRSGRHKMKVQRRESVMKDDLYSSPPDAKGATGGGQTKTQSSYNRNSGGTGGSKNYWEAEHSNSLRLHESHAMSSRPTVV